MGLSCLEPPHPHAVRTQHERADSVQHHQHCTRARLRSLPQVQEPLDKVLTCSVEAEDWAALAVCGLPRAYSCGPESPAGPGAGLCHATEAPPGAVQVCTARVIDHQLEPSWSRCTHMRQTLPEHGSHLLCLQLVRLRLPGAWGRSCSQIPQQRLATDITLSLAGRHLACRRHSCPASALHRRFAEQTRPQHRLAVHWAWYLVQDPPNAPVTQITVFRQRHT